MVGSDAASIDLRFAQRVIVSQSSAMLHRCLFIMSGNRVFLESGMVGPVIKQAAQMAARTAGPAVRTALGGAAAAARTPAARQGIAGLASRASAQASGPGRAALTPLRAALPRLRITAGEFAEAAAVDGMSSLIGVHVTTSPSIGGAAYEVAKKALMHDTPKATPASPGAGMAAGRSGAILHQPPAAGANQSAFAAVARPAGAPVGGSSPALQAFLKAHRQYDSNR
jgi:hypothetical protein